MRIYKAIVAFVLIFCTLAVTVVCGAVASEEMATVSDNSATEYEYEDFSDVPSVMATGVFTPRLTAPSKKSKYYYSDDNVFHKYGYGMPNCTCYAWGRAYEILGEKPNLCIYDAGEWFSYNKKNKYYSYGTTPKLGAIACYTYKNGGSGHVAVVEKITEDTVYYSNSAWSGQEFYISTSDFKDFTGGNKGWNFEGFIYIGDFVEGEQSGDLYRITSTDGVNMRKGAGTSYATVGAIPSNATVLVTETKKANGYLWGYTTYKGVSGWFVTDFAQLIESAPKPEQPTTPETQPPTEPETQVPTETVPPTEPQTQAPTTPLYELGDVDLDGFISILDATEIQMILSSKKEGKPEQYAVADFDNDGDISVLDATAIRLKLVGA